MNKRIAKKKAMKQILQLKKVKLDPNDVIILECKHPDLGPDNLYEVSEVLRRTFPNNRGIVLAPFMKMKVVSDYKECEEK